MNILSAGALVVTLLQAHTPAHPTAHKQVARPRSAARSRPTAAQNAAALQQQVMLDRAGFSPGVIDGQPGDNTRKALAIFQQQASDGAAAAPVEPLTRYHITADDAAGPFVSPMPSDMMEKSKLPALGYTSLLEALAERFHCTPALLQQLNPGATFAADQDIQVPNVEPMQLPAPAPKEATSKGTAPSRGAEPEAPKAAAQAVPPVAQAVPPVAPPAKPEVVVTVGKAAKALTVTDSGGRVMFYAPVTTGSEHDPLPLGTWKVNGVQRHPTFRYNPALFWDADPTHSKATIPAGPNNPVGVVWIDISKEHYGLHGTPEPETIGRTQSHGCVRLTNWDALKLAAMVKPGTRVVFTE